MSEPLVWGCKYTTLFFTMAMLLLTSSVLTIVCLFFGTWVSQGQENEYWEGSLFKPLTGLEQFDGMSYAEISRVYCTSANNQELDEQLFSVYKENCNLFFYLDLAGVGLILFEIMTVTIVAIWIVVLLMIVASVNCSVCGMCISIFPILTHTAGIVVYTTFSNIKIGESCGEIVNGNGSYSLCPEVSYGVILIIEVLFLLITVFMCILGFKYTMYHHYENLSQNSPVHSSSHNMPPHQEITVMSELTEIQDISKIIP